MEASLLSSTDITFNHHQHLKSLPHQDTESSCFSPQAAPRVLGEATGFHGRIIIDTNHFYSLQFPLAPDCLHCNITLATALHESLSQDGGYLLKHACEKKDLNLLRDLLVSAWASRRHTKFFTRHKLKTPRSLVRQRAPHKPHPEQHFFFLQQRELRPSV